MQISLFLVIVSLLLAVACGAGSTPVPTATPLATPTPIPDSDGDGLTDPRELELGTDPFQRDSDTDGLDDGQEVELGADPLFPDTDRDGVVDGDDVLPLADARVKVSIHSFTDETVRGLLHGYTNAYFTVLVEDEQPDTTEIYFDVERQVIEPIVINVPDNLSTVKVVLLAQESTPLKNFIKGTVVPVVTRYVFGIPVSLPNDDQPYDISKERGFGLKAKAMTIDVGARDSVEVTGSGADGGLKATVVVTVDHGGY